MIGKSNAFSGGVSAYAYIIAEYPSGAVASSTNTDGAIILSDTMTLFLVSDNASSCTVTVTRGGNSSVKTISVSAGESYYELFVFAHHFVINGVIQGSNMVAEGKRLSSGSTTPYASAPTVTNETGYISIIAGGTGTYNGAGIAYFPETIDLSKFTTLHVQGTARNNTGNLLQCAADVWSSIGSYQDENRRVQEAILSSSSSSFVSFDITADLSTYTDPAAYVGFNVRRNSSGYSGIHLTEVWVE